MPNNETRDIDELLYPLLQNEQLKLLLDRTELLDPVGVEGFRPRRKALQGPQVGLEILGQPLVLQPSAEVDVQIHAADDAVSDLFSVDQTYTAPEGAALAALGLSGKLNLGSRIPAISQGTLVLTFTGDSEAAFEYRHLLPVWQSDDRLTAFVQLASTSRLPSRLRLDQLRLGEVHRLDAKFNLSFGVEARWGKEFDIQSEIDLWDGLAASVRARAAANLQASLGWSMHEKLQLTVGRANVHNTGWVRLRLERSDQRRLTLGTVVELQATYDASELATVLQETLDQSPLPRLIDALQPIARGDWRAALAQLGERATATLDEYLGDTGWKEWAAQQEEVTQLVEVAQEVVEAYRDLDERLQGWWDRMLGRVDLGPDSKARRLLEIVAGIGDGSLEELLQDEDVRRALEWIEMLSGKSLEELVLASNTELREALERAAKLAQQALDFVDKLPEQAKQQIDAYASKLGILTTLEWLSEHATSKEALIEAVDQAAKARILQLIERLLGKPWELIQDEDLARVQSWAAKLLTRYDQLEARFQRVLERFKGELGFSLSFTLDRLSRHEALLDVEFDPTDPQLHTDLSQALREGNVRGLLEALPSLAGGEEPVAPRYLLREAVLSQKRVRTAKLTALFRFLGLQNYLRNQSEWSEEAQLRLRQTAAGIERSGLYAGGFRRANSDIQDAEASVWLETQVEDVAQHGLDPFAEGALRHRLRLTYQHSDDKTMPEERLALDKMLAKFGFLNTDGSLDNMSRQLGDAPVLDVRLALEIQLEGDAVGVVLQDLSAQGTASEVEEGWNDDYLAAARHWFQNPVLALHRFDVVKNLPLGGIQEDLLRHHAFESAWRRGYEVLTEQWLPGGKKVTVDGETVIVEPLNFEYRNQPQLLQRWRPEYNNLFFLAENRGPGLEAFQALARQTKVVAEERTQAALQRHGRLAALALAHAHPGYAGLKLNWNCPLFLTWLVLSRIERFHKQTLRQARGVATLRWRRPGEEAWAEPLHWTLKKGIPSL